MKMLFLFDQELLPRKKVLNLLRQYKMYLQMGCLCLELCHSKMLLRLKMQLGQPFLLLYKNM